MGCHNFIFVNLKKKKFTFLFTYYWLSKMLLKRNLMRIYGSFYPFWCLKVLEWFPSLLLLYAVSVNHGEMDDFSAARMILCGIPLDESYLQHRLSFLMKEEKKSLRWGKLHVPECCYLMGTVDPNGLLESDQVCVILYVHLLDVFPFSLW